MDIGFIGLGKMGQAMALRLLAAGYAVKVWNRSPEASNLLAAVGATVAGSPADVFSREVVISMLADDHALRSVLLDPNVLAQGHQGIHINMATISAGFSAELASLHQQYGWQYVAAPVMGRSDIVAQGKLNILAAGPDEAVTEILPVLEAIGQKVWRVGTEPHQANVLKLAANFMLASAIEATGEALSLVAGHGLPTANFLEIVTNTLFPGPVYKGYGELMVKQQYDPALFSANMGLKDIRLAMAAAAHTQLTLPLAELLQDHLQQVVTQDNGEKDIAILGALAAQRQYDA